MMSEPKLFADGRGVWCESSPGRTCGIEWQDVYKLGGYKVNGITEFYTCVVLDFEYGEFVELYDCWPGFAQVISAISDRLPGIDSDWFRRIDLLGIADPPIEVWRRH